MTGAGDMERLLRDWLTTDGPQDMPDHVLAEVLAKAGTTQRVRPWPALVTRILDATDALGAALAVPRPLARAWLLVAIGLVALMGAALIGLGAALLAPEATARNGRIAFEAGGDIWTVEPDGSELSAVAATADHEASPRWSPDGEHLAYTVTSDDDSVLVRITGPDGSDPLDLTPPHDVLVLPRAGIIGWSPDGRELAIPARITVLGSAFSEVFSEVTLIFDVVDRVPRVLDALADSSSFGWSPDGEWIGLLAGPNSQSRDLGVLTQGALLTISTDEAELVNLVGGPARWCWPADGAGSGSGCQPRGPAFSPDGRSVVFYMEARGGYDGDIFSISLEDSAITAIVDGPTNDVAPAVAPDGQHVAFSRSSWIGVPFAVARGIIHADPEYSRLAKPSDLYVADLDGRGERLIGRALWPGTTWAPDGSAAAALSMDWHEIHIIDMDGAGASLIIPSPTGGEIGALSWQPRPP